MTLALYGKSRQRQWLLAILGVLAIVGAAIAAFAVTQGSGVAQSAEPTIRKTLTTPQPDVNGNISWTVEVDNNNQSGDPQTYYVYDDLGGLELQGKQGCGSPTDTTSSVYACTIAPDSTGQLLFWSPDPEPFYDECTTNDFVNTASIVLAPDAFEHGPNSAQAAYPIVANPEECGEFGTYAICKIIAAESPITSGVFYIDVSTEAATLGFDIDEANTLHCDDVQSVVTGTPVQIYEDTDGWTATYFVNDIEIEDGNGVQITPSNGGCLSGAIQVQGQALPSAPTADCVVIIENTYTDPVYTLQVCKVIAVGSAQTSGTFTIEVNDEPYELSVEEAGPLFGPCADTFIFPEGQDAFIREIAPVGWDDPVYTANGIEIQPIQDGGIGIFPETCTQPDQNENGEQADLRIEAAQVFDCIVIVENNKPGGVPIEICKRWEDNADGTTESEQDFSILVDDVEIGAITVAEGDEDCLITYVEASAETPGQVIIAEETEPSFGQEAGYPKIIVADYQPGSPYETTGSEIDLVVHGDPIGCTDKSVILHSLVVAELIETPWCTVTFINRSVPGEVLGTGPIEVCKEFVDNEDGTLTGPTAFHFTVNGEPFGPIVVAEGDVECDIAIVELEVLTTIAEVPGSIDDAPGFPRVDQGSPGPELAKEGDSYTTSLFYLTDFYVCGTTIFLQRAEPLAVDVEQQIAEPACTITFYNMEEPQEEERPSPSPTPVYTGCTNINQCGPVTLVTPTPTNTAVVPPTETPVPPTNTPFVPETDIEGEKTPGPATPIAPDTGSGTGGSGLAGINLLLVIAGLLTLTAGMTVAAVARRRS